MRVRLKCFKGNVFFSRSYSIYSTSHSLSFTRPLSSALFLRVVLPMDEVIFVNVINLKKKLANLICNLKVQKYIENKS